jgi:hypothetical protein
MSSTILVVGAIFPSFTELETTVKSFALGQNADVAKENFAYCNEGPRTGCFKCSKAGAPRVKGQEQISKKCGCQWFVKFCRSSNGTYRVTGANLEHCHPQLSNRSENQSIYKRLKEDDLDKIHKFRELNVPVPVIMRLMATEGINVRPDELYGLIKREPDEVLALIKHLSSSPEFVVRSYVGIAASGTRTLKALFFTKKSQLALFKKCPEVVMLDCTYSTTTSNMPLCVLVGVDHNNSTFIIGTSLLIHETVDYFMWVLGSLLETSQVLGSAVKTILTDFDKAMELVFPSAAHQLCVWHLFLNFAKRFKGQMSHDDFERASGMLSSLAYAKTVDAFDQALTLLRSIFPSAFGYLEEVWLPVRQKWAFYSTSRNVNLGCVSTSRVEGTHAVIKRCLTKKVRAEVLLGEI